MDSNGLNFWMLSRAQDWAANTPVLAASVGASDAQVTVLSRLPWGVPLFLLIDAEVMSVQSIDFTGTVLGVNRGVQSTVDVPHAVGTPVLIPVGILQAAVGVADTKVTIAAAPKSAVPSPQGIPGFLQIDGEVMAVVQVDSTGTVATVTRGVLGTQPHSHNSGSPAFAPIAANSLYYCTKTNRLQLLSMRLGTAPPESFAQANTLMELAPMARDAFRNYARWDAASGKVLAGGSGPGEETIYTPTLGQTVTDLAMGYDGILYLAVSGTLVMVDRRGRWPDFTLTAAGFNFWRLCALPQGGVLALDRITPQLGTVTGAPLQTGPVDMPDPGILRSCVPNGDPPRLSATYPLPASETFVGSYCNG